MNIENNIPVVGPLPPPEKNPRPAMATKQTLIAENVKDLATIRDSDPVFWKYMQGLAAALKEQKGKTYPCWDLLDDGSVTKAVMVLQQPNKTAEGAYDSDEWSLPRNSSWVSAFDWCWTRDGGLIEMKALRVRKDGTVHNGEAMERHQCRDAHYEKWAATGRYEVSFRFGPLDSPITTCKVFYVPLPMFIETLLK